MDSKLSRWCDGFLEAGWLVALIVTPLFFNIHSERVFEPDKLTLLRSIALLMALVWIVKFIDQQGWKDLSWLKWNSADSVWRKPLVLPVVAIIIVYFISTAISVAPRTSFWGSYQRLQGTYTTLSYIVIFAMVASTVRTRQQVQRIITVIIITSIPVSLYGLLQRFQLDPLPWGGDTSNRIAGHMGNAIFISAYLIMAIPLTLTRIIDSFYHILLDEELEYADVVRSSIYILALAIQTIATVFSQSRGPLLGIGIGLFTYILFLLVTLRNNASASNRTNNILFPLLYLGLAVGALYMTGPLNNALGATRGFYVYLGIIAVLILSLLILAAARRGWGWLWVTWIMLIGYLGGVLLVYNIASADIQTFRDNPVGAPLADTFESWGEINTINRLGGLLTSSGSGSVRILIWRGVIDLVSPHEPIAFPDGTTDRWNALRPLFGYGPEAMYVAYNRFYPPELATVEARNASPDRSHNETFDAVVITGVVGFIAWQVLYVATLYYGLSHVGMVRGKRDRNLLIAAWIIGAIVASIAIVNIFSLEMLGVAIPFGSVIGLVIYLIYYALTASSAEARLQQYNVDTLIMVGLVAAIIAFFIEIHFGIAIAATRLHSFVFMALIYVVGYVLPTLDNEAEEVAAEQAKTPARGSGRKSRSRRGSTPARSTNGAAWAMMLILSTLVITLFFDFLNFVPTQEQAASWQSADDLPSALDIVRSSLLVNPRNNFAESPYLYGVMVLSWFFAALLLVSEMVKNRELPIHFTTATPEKQNQQIAGALMGMLGLLGLAISAMQFTSDTFGNTQRVALMLAAVWTILSLGAAIALFVSPGNGRSFAGAVASVGMLFAFSLLLTGATWQSLLIVALSGATLYFLWDSSWQHSYGNLLTIGLASWAIASVYGILHGSLIRGSFIAPSSATGQPLQGLERNIVEAERIGIYLSTYYVAICFLLLVTGLGFAWYLMGRSKQTGSALGLGALVILLGLGFFWVDRSNLNIIQADMTYKRGKPFDQQAGQLARQVNQAPAEQQQQILDASITGWRSAVAVYERTVEMAPNEDFYYLWLGRAYLEQSSINLAAQEDLLETAEQRLFRAQSVNPLNTDHTANLARLNVRWAQLVDPGTDRDTRVAEASAHYEEALRLSPQNSIIRNEYAGLTFQFNGGCDPALAIYDDSLGIDPYYPETYYRKVETHLNCAQSSGSIEPTHLTAATETLRPMLDFMPRKSFDGAEQRMGSYLVQIANAWLISGDTAQARSTLNLLNDNQRAEQAPQIEQLESQISQAEGG